MDNNQEYEVVGLRKRDGSRFTNKEAIDTVTQNREKTNSGVTVAHSDNAQRVIDAKGNAHVNKDDVNDEKFTAVIGERGIWSQGLSYLKSGWHATQKLWSNEKEIARINKLEERNKHVRAAMQAGYGLGDLAIDAVDVGTTVAMVVGTIFTAGTADAPIAAGGLALRSVIKSASKSAMKKGLEKSGSILFHGTKNAARERAEKELAKLATKEAVAGTEKYATKRATLEAYKNGTKGFFQSAYFAGSTPTKKAISIGLVTGTRTLISHVQTEHIYKSERELEEFNKAYHKLEEQNKGKPIDPDKLFQEFKKTQEETRYGAVHQKVGSKLDL